MRSATCRSKKSKRVVKNPRTRVEKVQGYRMYFLTMNVTHKPFDNKLVRQAFNYSVDPTVILNTSSRETAMP